MKQSPIRAVSTKRAAQNREYRRLSLLLNELARYHSEWNGAECCFLEAHHIDGRRGDRLLDPFNIILLTAEQHRTFQAHNSWEVRQALKLWVRPLRLAQGFRDG